MTPGKVAATVICGLVVALATESSLQAQQEIADRFLKRSQTYHGFTMPYRLFVPDDYDPSTPYPLILALHGAGERGSDNERQIVVNHLATTWATSESQAAEPAFVVAPQVPEGGRWTSDQPVDESDFVPEELTTLAILDSLEREFNIDPERLYVVGLSMGGHGVWDLISRLPERFAAAAPMSGNAYPNQAPHLQSIPIWGFHGESDRVVYPYGARGMVQALEDLGREVLYTDCRRSPVFETNFDCPGTISDSRLEQAILEHADLIYTSVKNGGHGPWNPWFDDPLLHLWLFSKQRVRSDALGILEPSRGDVWSGVGTIRWSIDDAPGDTVEVWMSFDNGVGWEHIGDAPSDDTSFVFDTGVIHDAPIVRARLFAINSSGRVYAKATSAPFRIDNEGDGAPYLDLNDESFRFDPEVEEDEVDLRLTIADPEASDLDAQILYSIDGGDTFTKIQSLQVQSSFEVQSLPVDLAGLPNSHQAQLQVVVSDLFSSVSATTATFIKNTIRDVSDFVDHVAGEGHGTVALHFIDPGDLTNHRYQVAIDATDPYAKTYSVFDLDLGSSVLTGIPLSDGVLESPLFDGMSLVVEDLEVGMADLESTGWIEGDSNLEVTISGGSVLVAVLRVQLLETDDEYQINITDTVSDTSVAGFGMPARPLQFNVTARSDGLRRKILFKDAAADGRLGGGDVLYIMEPDRDAKLVPSWELRFTASASTELPESGDVFLFVPVKKLGSDDVFEFTATHGLGVEPSSRPGDISALAVFPNPYSDQLTISYRLLKPARVSVAVYDVLGRRVSVLRDGIETVGEHRITASSANRHDRLGSGLHLISVSVEPLDGGPSHTYHEHVVRVR